MHLAVVYLHSCKQGVPPGAQTLLCITTLLIPGKMFISFFPEEGERPDCKLTLRNIVPNSAFEDLKHF